MKLPSQKSSFKSFDGTDIAYEILGEGPPLIFCYGLVCRQSMWRHQINYFKKNYQLIFFDYRGHNASKLPKKIENLTIQNCAKDLFHLCETLQMDKATLLGHSMGVNVAFEFAKRYPERVRSIVAICGTIENPFKYMFHTDLSQIGFETLKLIYLKFPDHFSAIWKKSMTTPASQLLTSLLGFNLQLSQQKDIKNYLEGVANQPLDTFFYLLQDMVEKNGFKNLDQIQAPVLVIGGENDFITPFKTQLKLYKHLPHAQCLKVPKGSHCSHMDMPDLVNLRIEKFLKEL